MLLMWLLFNILVFAIFPILIIYSLLLGIHLRKRVEKLE